MVGCGGSSNNNNQTCEPSSVSPDIGICTAAQFNDIIRGDSNNLSRTYQLLADINLSNYSPWEPIGTNATEAFTGKLKGNGHTIGGLKFQHANGSILFSNALYTGLFGYIDKAEITNLSVEAGYDFSALTDSHEQYFGIIAGYANGANLTKITVSSSSTSYTIRKSGSDVHAGGIVGVANDTLIDKSTSSLKFIVSNPDNASIVGGIAGYNNGSGVISNSYTTGYIVANGNNEAYAGGIVGYNKANINNTYATGNISANYLWSNTFGSNDDTVVYAGSIAGYSLHGNISNSAALNGYILASSNDTAKASRIAYGGGDNNFANNFALFTITLSDKNGTHLASNASLANSADGLGKDSSELGNQFTWSNLVDGLGWNFNTIPPVWEWDYENNRPVLY
jgi:hypothetical protein